MNEIIIGIDLGTTNSEVAIVEQEAIARLAPRLGDLQGNCVQP